MTSATSSRQMALDGSVPASLFSLAALFFLGRAIYRMVRHYLADGIRAPKRARFVEWWPCLFLFPMLIRYAGGETHTKNEGYEILTRWGYGSEASAVAIILSISVIALFQICAGLSGYDKGGM